METDAPYKHSQIWMNGRFISVNAILTGEIVAKTPFEERTCTFIKEWLSGKETFTLTTSGSTGPPKEIIITRSQMIASASLTREAIGLKDESSNLVCIDTDFIGGKM